jgi:hypothetical protein
VPIITHNPIVAQEPDDFFDFTSQSIRASTFTFNVVEVVTGMVVGTIHPLRDSVPTLAHDTTRGVKRTLTLALDTRDTADFDTITHRVDVAMETGDGRTFPLGRYMAASDSRMPTTAGDFGSLALVDEMFVLAQPISRSFTAALTESNVFWDGVGRSSAYTTMQRFLDRYTLFNPDADNGALTSGTGVNLSVQSRLERDIEFSNYLISGSWQTGTDGTSVISDIATAGDWFTPWMGNDRQFHMVRAFDAEDAVPRFDFDEQQNVIRNSITRTDDLLNAPNRIIVVSNSGMAESRTDPVVGSFDIPDSAPHAISRRGFVIPEVVDMQIETRAQAQVVARNIGTHQRVVERVELSTPPDPRHDSYDVIRWNGLLWLETGWSMSLVEGGQMSHRMQRIFQ